MGSDTHFSVRTELDWRTPGWWQRIPWCGNPFPHSHIWGPTVSEVKQGISSRGDTRVCFSIRVCNSKVEMAHANPDNYTKCMSLYWLRLKGLWWNTNKVGWFSMFFFCKDDNVYIKQFYKSTKLPIKLPSKPPISDEPYGFWDAGRFKTNTNTHTLLFPHRRSLNAWVSRGCCCKPAFGHQGFFYLLARTLQSLIFPF